MVAIIRILPKGLLIFLVIIILLSCEDSLPRPSKKGKNTFGCVIDGKRFIPKGNTLFSMASYPNLSIDYKDQILYIDAHNLEDSPAKHIYIHLKDVSHKGKYPINFDFDPRTYNNKTNYGTYEYNKESYITSSDLPGHVTITKLDTFKKIISGTFEFEVKGFWDPTQKVRITKGRFDFNY